VRPSLDDLNPAIREFNGLVKAGIAKKKLAFIINCTSSQTEEKNTREYLSEADYFAFSTSLLDRVSYREAQNQGLSIGEVKYERLREKVRKLVKEIISIIYTI
jgi:chromosome partitioning protein